MRKQWESIVSSEVGLEQESSGDETTSTPGKYNEQKAFRSQWTVALDR